MKLHRFNKATSERLEYAREEEFYGVFKCERAGLQRLALLLTANAEAVKQCLIRAFRQCIANNAVSKEWALTWARRMVIRNAISLVTDSNSGSLGSKQGADNQFIGSSQDDFVEAIAEHESILDLPELDRLVFVICVLEGYSIYDCALLLGRIPRDIHEAHQRVSTRAGVNSSIFHNTLRLPNRAFSQRRSE